MKKPTSTGMVILAIIAGASTALYQLLSGEMPNLESAGLALAGAGYFAGRLAARNQVKAAEAETAQLREKVASLQATVKTNTDAPHGPRR